MNRTVRKTAERLRRRNEFDDLLNIYERDKGTVTLPARMAVNALASFEHAESVTAELNVQQTRRVAAAQATQAPKGPPPGMPGDAARVLYPPPHHGGARSWWSRGAVVEDSPRLVADSPTTQWRPQVSPTTLWGHLGHHRQHLAQGVLV